MFQLVGDIGKQAANSLALCPILQTTSHPSPRFREAD